MTHCTFCHQEVSGMAQHLPKCVKGGECSICPSKELQELGEVIAERSRKGTIEWVGSIFGDFPNKGYIEEFLITDKGRQMKFYGCQIPYRGVCRVEVVDSIANVKRTLITSLELVYKYRYLLILLVPFWKKVLKDGVEWLVRIYHADLEKKTYKSLDEFSPVTAELLRAGIEMAKTNFPIGNHIHLNCENGKSKTTHLLCPLLFQNKVIRFFWCLLSFIQFDHAYYYRVHDFFFNLNPRVFSQRPRAELNYLFELSIRREHQIQGKLKLIKRLVNYAMLFPPTKKMIYNYVMSLDTDKFIPDNYDRYWYGRRAGYDFEGESFTERSKFSDGLDERLGNVIIR